MDKGPSKEETLFSIIKAAQLLNKTNLHPEQIVEIRNIDEKLWSIIDYLEDNPTRWMGPKDLRFDI